MCVYIHTYISVYEYVHMHVLYTGFSGGSVVKNLPANAGDTGSIPGLERSPEDKIATHFSILAWKIPRTEAPGRLQSMGVTKSYHWVIKDTHTVEMYQYHIIFLICISLMTNDVEYLCMCLLVLHKYKRSFVKCLHEFSGPFFTGLFEFVWRKRKCLR